MAVLIARTHTGRRKLIAIEGGYHGSSPWMQARGRAGISERDHQELIRIPWNDLPALQSALLEHPGEIAAFISSPYHHPVYEDNALPDSGYWKGVHEILREHQVLSICDDVRAGFRLHMEGSPAYFGYTPDLSCYCKAIANGYPIAAVVGRGELKDAAASVFQTGSFWFSAGPMAAALACLRELKRLEVPARVLKTGTALWSGCNRSPQTPATSWLSAGFLQWLTCVQSTRPGRGFIRPCVESARGGVIFNFSP